MPRYFLIQDPELKDLVQDARAKLNVAFARRCEFLKNWGSPEILHNGHMQISGLRDPRKFDPSQPLPKGWRSIRSKPYGFVEPKDPSVLEDISDPYPNNLLRTVMRRVLDKCEDGDLATVRKAIERPLTDHQRMLWFSATQSKVFFPNAYLFNYFPVCVSIPDPTLKFEIIPGLREVFAWQFKNMLEAENLQLQEAENVIETSS